jgi:hypothetical protein
MQVEATGPLHSDRRRENELDFRQRMFHGSRPGMSESMCESRSYLPRSLHLRPEPE